MTMNSSDISTAPMVDVAYEHSGHSSVSSRLLTTNATIAIPALRHVTTYLRLIYPGACCVLGIPLNAANVLAMYQRMVMTSHFVYVTLLSLVDSVALIHKLVFFLYTGVTPEYCRYMQFMIELSSQLSSWILVILSIERAIVVKFPFLRLTVLRNRKRALFSVGATAVCLALTNFHLFFTVTSSQDLFCMYKDKTLPIIKQYWYIIEIMLYAFIPMAFLIGSNLVVIECLFHRKVSNDRQTQPTNWFHTRRLMGRRLHGYSATDNSQNATNNNSNHSSADVQFKTPINITTIKNDVRRKKTNKKTTTTTKELDHREFEEAGSGSELKVNNQRKRHVMDFCSERNYESSRNGKYPFKPVCVFNQGRNEALAKSDAIEVNQFPLRDSPKYKPERRNHIIFKKMRRVDGGIRVFEPDHPKQDIVTKFENVYVGTTSSKGRSVKSEHEERCVQDIESDLLHKKPQKAVEKWELMKGNQMHFERKGNKMLRNRRRDKNFQTNCIVVNKGRQLMANVVQINTIATGSRADTSVATKTKSDQLYDTCTRLRDDENCLQGNNAFGKKSKKNVESATSKSQFIKTTKSVLVASATFILLTSPFCVCSIYSLYYYHDGASETFQLLATIAFALRDLNHVANFFIYTRTISIVTLCGLLLSGFRLCRSLVR